VSFSQGVRAINVRVTSRSIVMKLENGRTVRVSFKVSKRLWRASARDRGCMELNPSGLGIHWPALDEDLSVAGLLRSLHEQPGVFGGNHMPSTVHEALRPICVCEPALVGGSFVHREGCPAVSASTGCKCIVLDGERYARGSCMAFHDVKAVGFVNHIGECVRGDWAGRGWDGKPGRKP
jgi:hypothetical protein